MKVRGAAPLGSVRRPGEDLSGDQERVGCFLLRISDPATFVPSSRFGTWLTAN